MASETGTAEESFVEITAGFSVTPALNPGSGAFSIRLQGVQGAAEITVYDASGRTVASAVSDNELVTLDAASLPAGVYTVAARNSGSVSTCRMVLTD